jgi:hypothetical protein
VAYITNTLWRQPVRDLIVADNSRAAPTLVEEGYDVALRGGGRRLASGQSTHAWRREFRLSLLSMLSGPAPFATNSKKAPVIETFLRNMSVWI